MNENLPEENQTAVPVPPAGPIEVQPNNSANSAANPPQNGTPVKIAPRRSHLKIVLVILVLVIILGAVLAFVLFRPKTGGAPKTEERAGAKQLEPANIEKHDKALVGYYLGNLTEKQIGEITAGREKVIKYASDNGITVTDEEVQARKDFLIKQSGSKEKVLASVAVYGWSEEDWASVLWWQILREKVMDKFQAYREGEVIAVRWDSFSPDPAKVAPVKSPVAKEYLEGVRKKLMGGEIKNLKEVADTVKTREIQLGADSSRFVFQYTGLNNEGKYFRFLMDAKLASTQFLATTKIPEVPEATCSIGACLLYNVVGGSNGSSENTDVKDFLNGKLLI